MWIVEASTASQRSPGAMMMMMMMMWMKDDGQVIEGQQVRVCDDKCPNAGTCRV